jgi:hypothetical protein
LIFDFKIINNNAKNEIEKEKEGLENYFKKQLENYKVRKRREK